jgi:pimeloyl-ACP methyl ester carboxylesterase
MFGTLAKIAAICESEEIVEAEIASPIEFTSDISELAAASDRRTGSRRIEPLFFGAENRSLFGCHHPARDTPRPCAIVLCYPMGEEYIHFHRAYRQLAENLATVGFPVFRFDFSGCGDSAGDSESSNLDHWLEDISLAIDESKRKNDVEQICLVGFRMGATLAALAGASRSDIDAVVLLDPIIHGPSYLAELREWHAKMLRLASVRPRSDNGIRGEEILGFEYGKQLIKGIEGLDLESIPKPLFDSALVVESREYEYTGPFLQRLGAQGSKTSHLHIPHPELWTKTDRFQLEDVNRVQMPRKILQAAASWVKKRYA